eukprot:1220354-Ditylum_brightwellii.AAC.1
MTVIGIDKEGNKVRDSVVKNIVLPGADSNGENPVPGRNVSGKLPGKELGKLKYLEEITMNHNKLAGSIPTELMALDDLYWVDFTGNDMTGTVPQFGEGLQYLYMGDNDLSGELPAFEESKEYQMTHLWIYNNNLSGSIPATMGTTMKHM